MKKIKYLLIPVFCFILAINSFALTTNTGTYEFEDQNAVVIFDESSVLSADKQELIANRLVYGAPEDSGIQTYSWCWLTGHDLITETVTVLYHKDREISPRCRQEIYQCDTCTKCDYMSEERLIVSSYITCCPED